MLFSESQLRKITLKLLKEQSGKYDPEKAFKEFLQENGYKLVETKLRIYLEHRSKNPDLRIYCLPDKKLIKKFKEGFKKKDYKMFMSAANTKPFGVSNIGKRDNRLKELSSVIGAKDAVAQTQKEKEEKNKAVVTNTQKEKEATKKVSSSTNVESAKEISDNALTKYYRFDDEGGWTYVVKFEHTGNTKINDKSLEIHSVTNYGIDKTSLLGNNEKAKNAIIQKVKDQMLGAPQSAILLSEKEDVLEKTHEYNDNGYKYEMNYAREITSVKNRKGKNINLSDIKDPALKAIYKKCIELEEGVKFSTIISKNKEEIQQEETEEVVASNSIQEDSTVYYPLKKNPSYNSGLKVTSHASPDREVEELNKRGAHKGIDLAGNLGDNIYACKGGEVRRSKNNPGGYGNYIDILSSDGYYIRYAHMQDPSKFKAGDSVNAGDIIGYVGSTGGSTGPHLHIEIIPDYVGSDFPYGTSNTNKSIEIMKVLFKNAKWKE